MVHVPAKFRENTSMRFRITVRKLNVTDRQMDGRTDGTAGQMDGWMGGIAISSIPGLKSGVIFNYKLSLNILVIHFFQANFWRYFAQRLANIITPK